MSRETKYTAIILKKQPFGEADEIITFFSLETGKIRALAKSVKLAKSKMQNALQTLFLVELALAGRGNLPKIISAEVKDAFPALREDLEAIKPAYYACELVLKFMPDGQSNPELYTLLKDFFKHLETGRRGYGPALVKFKAGFLNAAGLSPAAHEGLQKESGSLKVCKDLEACAFVELDRQTWQGLEPLQNFLSDFITHHLEREIKSENFLKTVV